MNKNDAIYKMNQLGLKKIPFLFIIDFEMRAPLVLTLEEVQQQGIYYEVNNVGNSLIKKIPSKKIYFKKSPISYSKYKAAFDIVSVNIKNGNSYLLNLTFPTKVETNLTLEEIFLLSTAKYKLLLPGKFVVFSPETFVQIKEKKIYSCPMKGTIDASVENAQDKILNDPKEIAEHTTIVDLIRNDLSMVAKNVRVEKFRYIEKIKTNDKTLLQISSSITGEMTENYNHEIGDIIFKLLPAGSISGAPKRKTVEIIKEAECYERGYYTGIFGMFDGENLDSAVMIRFIEKQSDEFIFKSGGGITALSDPRSEYQELIDKVYVPII